MLYNFFRLIITKKLADRVGIQTKYINCYDIYTVSSTREVTRYAGVRRFAFS